MYESAAAASRVVSNSKWLHKRFDLTLVDLGPRLLALTAETALLPEGFHCGPGGRLVAATARVYNRVLCTRDEKLPRFGERGVHKVLEVEVS